MHRVWNIAEVVHEIVTHVDQKSLPALARTARLFEQPASARIYAVVGGDYLDHLVSQLTSRSDDDYGEATVRRARCLTQAKFVRRILVPYLTIPICNVLPAPLILLRWPLYPFPHLRKIEVGSDEANIVELLDLLLCPMLESLSFRMHLVSRTYRPNWESKLFFFLQGLPEKASRISSLRVEMDVDVQPFPERFEVQLANVFGETCRRLPLVSVSTVGIPSTPGLLNALSSLYTLKSIKLSEHLRKDTPGNLVDPRQYAKIPGTNVFRSLKNVELVGNSMIGEVVKSLHGAALRTLIVKVKSWGPHMAVLLEAVCSFSSTLEVLKLGECWDESYKFPQESYITFTLPNQALRPLSCCSGLRIFHFIFGWKRLILGLTVGDLEQLATSWTNVEEIHIKYGGTVGSSLTLEAFVPFSVGCPNLSDITITPLSPTVSIQVPSASFPAHPWTALSIGLPKDFVTLSLQQATKIAHYLDLLWSDVFLSINSRQDDLPGVVLPIETMNAVLDVLRTGRALRAGSRWHDKHPGGMHLLTNAPLVNYFELASTCPWEIVA